MRCFFFLIVIISLPLVSFGQQKSKPAKHSVELIFTKTEIEPEFKGGQSAWIRFLSKNMRFPDSCNIEDLQLTMTLKFIVFKSGKVGKIKMLHGSPCMENEIIRIIKLTDGQWTPAIHNGKFVNCYKQLPVIIEVRSE
jgi:periplasmic protein TonB